MDVYPKMPPSEHLKAPKNKRATPMEPHVVPKSSPRKANQVEANAFDKVVMTTANEAS